MPTSDLWIRLDISAEELFPVQRVPLAHYDTYDRNASLP